MDHLAGLPQWETEEPGSVRTSQSESVPASSVAVTRFPAAACWYTESQVLSCMNRELCGFGVNEQKISSLSFLLLLERPSERGLVFSYCAQDALIAKGEGGRTHRGGGDFLPR